MSREEVYARNLRIRILYFAILLRFEVLFTRRATFFGLLSSPQHSSSNSQGWPRQRYLLRAARESYIDGFGPKNISS